MNEELEKVTKPPEQEGKGNLSLLELMDVSAPVAATAQAEGEHQSGGFAQCVRATQSGSELLRTKDSANDSPIHLDTSYPDNLIARLTWNDQLDRSSGFSVETWGRDQSPYMEETGSDKSTVLYGARAGEVVLKELTEVSPEWKMMNPIMNELKREFAELPACTVERELPSYSLKFIHPSPAKSDSASVIADAIISGNNLAGLRYLQTAGACTAEQAIAKLNYRSTTGPFSHSSEPMKDGRELHQLSLLKSDGSKFIVASAAFEPCSQL